jgi:hypothetical protein
MRSITFAFGREIAKEPYMKIHHLLLTGTVAAALVFASGCGKTESSSGAASESGGSAGASANVDTSKFSAAFQAAAADVKPVTDAVVNAVKGADYSSAIEKLKDLGGKYKITPEQQQAVSDLLAQVQKALGGAATKATEGASKAANDLGNALKK